LDPFLLLDDFHSDNPDEYIKGFPWHPHRGIETITYVLYGKVEHGDSMGNKGTISSGDIQWMTAGSGIIHQEMPKGQEDGLMWGFQLWANLPASHKMMDPRYQDIKSNQVPEITLDGGVNVKIICGEINGLKGPIQDIVIDPEYLDITVPPKSSFTHSIKTRHKAFAYVIEGEGFFDQDRDSNAHEMVGPESLVIFDDGDEVAISTQDRPMRSLFVSGKPIGEPVAWHGPIVMNTQEELRIAFEEYEKGTFIKS
jgi:redox-sensitive bicupin YhaK (pirin superfamily)